jgi:hypothetical protein
MAHIPLTANVFATWMPASEALPLVAKAIGDYEAAAGALINRLKSGLVQAYAENVIAEADGKSSSMDSIIRMEPSVWKALTEHGYPWHHQFWKTNDAVVETTNNDRGYRQHSVLRYFGIRVELSGIQKMIPQKIASPAPTAPSLRLDRPAGPQPRSAPATAPASTIVPTKGGRPAKEFWHDLLIAIFKQIWDGELQPQTQADIERAMLDWASEHGHDLGETSVKVPAKKLFAACQK